MRKKSKNVKRIEQKLLRKHTPAKKDNKDVQELKKNIDNPEEKEKSPLKETT